MTAFYEVRIYSPAGALMERLVGASGADFGDNSYAGWLKLSYTLGVNEIGVGAFTIHADSDALDSLVEDGDPILDTQVEIWRRDDDNNLEPYCDFYGFLRDHEFSTDDNGTTTYTALLAEQVDLLRRSIVAYRKNIANRSYFDGVATETIMKTLVQYNATSSGTTADGRDRNVDPWGTYISVDSDDGEGDIQTVSCADRNLFDILREIGENGGQDIWFVKTGARAWEFRTDNKLGDDRTDTVTFSLLHGNMRRPTLRSNRRAERTVAIVGGQGIDGDRDMAVRTGANYNGTVNSYEVFVNASQYSTSDGLDSAGDVRLEQLRARDQISFDVIQVPSTIYGRDYFMGDVVTAHYLGKSYTPRIMRVAVSVQASSGHNPPETIRVVMADA